MTAITGHAAGVVTVGGVAYEWSPSDLGYIAIGWDEETPIQSLHILGEVDGLDVVGIAAGAFEDNSSIVFLTIDEGIGYIGENAFARCTALQVAILPEGLVTIQEEAFAFCSRLTTLAIPSTVEDIQAHAFSGCTGVTDVYFLMDEDQLEYFHWWDGVYPAPGEEQHGGMEFNESRLPGHNPESGTRIHVPDGLYNAYDESGKFEAWLLQQDDGCYPLWWIVNYGVVGRSYTVCDELMAVYTDVEGSLYAKDDNRWLTPDRFYSGEVNYVRLTGLMKERGNVYDQSNWVALVGATDPEVFNGNLLEGSSVTGILIDKKNPVMELTTTPVVAGPGNYMPNIYIPCSFMGRTQQGTINMGTYAFVQPKPQEYIQVEWAVYHEGDEGDEFYFAEPDLDEGVNRNGLYGGFLTCPDLYEDPPMPVMEEGGYYAFPAINRRMTASDQWLRAARPAPSRQGQEPYVSAGRSAEWLVYPLSLPDEPIITAVTEVTPDGSAQSSKGWQTVDGRYLGTNRPADKGIYIHDGNKVAIIK